MCILWSCVAIECILRNDVIYQLKKAIKRYIEGSNPYVYHIMQNLLAG